VETTLVQERPRDGGEREDGLLLGRRSDENVKIRSAFFSAGVPIRT
jgi:hypothetical protein